MADRQLLADDARMVSMAQLSNAAHHSEMASEGSGLVGVELTIVCGLDADSRKEPIRFAACLARRLGWRLSLVPLSDVATPEERLDRLLAASARDQAGLVVAEAVQSGAGAAALVEASRYADCPLIAVPHGAPALGAGPILCGIDSRGPSGPTARAASGLAEAIGARLRLVHVVPHPRTAASEADGPHGVVRRALHALVRMDAEAGWPSAFASVAG